MSVSAHIAAQRTDHGVPHAVSCRALGVPSSTFYKWRGRPPTRSQRRRAELDVEVKACFDASAGTYGSPRVRARLRSDGIEVSKKTVEASMARQGLQARVKRRRRGLTRPDKAARPVPDLLRRDFTAEAVNQKWVGDFKQVSTGEGPVFLATVEDLFSRRMLGFAQSDAHPTAELATAALNMAAAARGGDIEGVIFHTDKGSQGIRPISVHPLQRAPRRERSRQLGGIPRRQLRQRAGRDDHRALQDRARPPPRPLARPRRPRARHPGMGRLVQPPPAPPPQRRPRPASRSRRPPLPSTTLTPPGPRLKPKQPA